MFLTCFSTGVLRIIQFGLDFGPQILQILSVKDYFLDFLFWQELLVLLFQITLSINFLLHSQEVQDLMEHCETLGLGCVQLIGRSRKQCLVSVCFEGMDAFSEVAKDGVNLLYFFRELLL